MKKACSGCGKQIPEAALHCVFCGAKQASAEAQADLVAAGIDGALEDAAARAGESSAGISGDASSSASLEEAAGASSAPSPASSRAGVTMLGLRVEDLQAEARRADGAAPMSPLLLDPTPVRGLPVVPDPRVVQVVEGAGEGAGAEPPPFSSMIRFVMASGGLVLVALFLLPWRGVSSWDLLETLAGADFVRQLYFLAGGAVLLATALVPVPMLFRATVGATVASLPLILGAEGMLDGWRGLVAALAVVVLPATHLLRMRPGSALDGLARGLVVLAVSLVAVLYLVPISSVSPLVYVGRLLVSGAVVSTVVGLFISIPLVLSALSLLGALGRDLTSAAVLLAVLILLWPPAAVLMFIDDGTQLYVAPALLWTSATAALCTAQLLSFAASKAQAET